MENKTTAPSHFITLVVPLPMQHPSFEIAVEKAREKMAARSNYPVSKVAIYKLVAEVTPVPPLKPEVQVTLAQ